MKQTTFREKKDVTFESLQLVHTHLLLSLPTHLEEQKPKTHTHLTMWEPKSPTEAASPLEVRARSDSKTKVPGRRFAQIVKLKPEHLAEYKDAHAKVWPEVLKQIKACNIADCKWFFLWHCINTYVYTYTRTHIHIHTHLSRASDSSPPKKTKLTYI